MLFLSVLVALAAAPSSQAQLVLGAAELVGADGGDIAVPGYSVPSLVEWDEDGLPDLIVGEGSGTYTGKVRVYRNIGTGFQPQFSTYTYAQSNGADLELLGGG